MSDFISLEISDGSRIPKYKQIVQSVIAKIQTGQIQYGQKLPSINKLSTHYLLARDTVEKAYNELRDQGIIESVKWKGYYVCNSAPKSRIKILVLFNKLSAYKKEIYNAIAHELEDRAQIDFFIYHCDIDLFERIIHEHHSGYHYYVIMPHFSEENPGKVQRVMDVIPAEKIILIDHKHPDIQNYFASVYQDFKLDIFNALDQVREKIKKYGKLILVFPDSRTYPYPKEIIQGFIKFCSETELQYQITNDIEVDHIIQKGSVYIVIGDNDLANLIKLTRANNYKLGADVGVISYNDTALKEVLAEGITVMSTDFLQMGKTVGRMILENTAGEVKNEFRLISRNSL